MTNKPLFYALILLAGCSIGTSTSSVYPTQAPTVGIGSAPTGLTVFKVSPEANKPNISDEDCTKWITTGPRRAFITAALGVASGGSGIVTVIPEDQQGRLVPGLISLGFGMLTAGMGAYSGAVSFLANSYCVPATNQPQSQPIGALSIP